MEQDKCLVFSEPQAWLGTQVQRNLGGVPMHDGEVPIAWFKCPKPCTEVCNPPHAPGLEMEPPADRNGCNKSGDVPKKICKQNDYGP